ncbi:tannase and feruloyl esterase-domain-containing protein [Daldinia sp. FL1419]|nr:tannase and feruloyl esterase-domain-containing protein [Daldinia sp. FL1419]
MTACDLSIFGQPLLKTAVVVSLSAQLITNYSLNITPILYPNHGGPEVKNAAFSAGGSGLGPGRFYLSYGNMAGAVAEGYATTSTDAGIANPLDPYSWVLDGAGEVNEVLEIIAKGLIRDFYGKPSEYSYSNGCSQGGRQDLELAQNHPTAYDAMYWPQMLTNTIGEYPHGCELDFLASPAVRKCDGLGGVVDGIISNPKACVFDPFLHVGGNFTCITERKSMKLSRTAAIIVNARWTRPINSHSGFIWYGLNHGTDLSGTVTGTGIAATACNESNCQGNPIPLAYQRILLFAEKDPNYDYTNIS